MQNISGVSYEDFQNISGSLSENSSQIVSGSSDLEKINDVQDTVDLNPVPSGSENISDSGTYSSGSSVYNYYIYNYDPNSGSLNSEQAPAPASDFSEQVADAVPDYSVKFDKLTDITMYILLFTILILISTIFYRFRIKGGLK